MYMGQLESNMSPYTTQYRANPIRTKNDWYYTNRSIKMEHQAVTINKSQYMFEKKIGVGKFSSVYAARRRQDNEQVAIKVISLVTKHSTEAEKIARSVLNEIEMARRLAKTSNHIVHMYDFDFHRHTGLAYIVMELGQQNLERYLSHKSTLSSPERKSIWRQLVDIAVVLQTNQIVHSNIKPSSLVLFSGNIIKLVDLGMAQKVRQSRVGSYGTPQYSAPELISSYSKPTISTKANIWSLGAVLYHMTYMTAPDHNPPCDRPPQNQRPTHDAHLRHLLQHILAIDPKARPDALWLARHPYTTTH